MAENPFTPSFGTVPPIMTGRDGLLGGMTAALSKTRRDPLLSSLFVGARGTGKTALLARIRNMAAGAGWVAVGSVALPGLLEDVFEQARMASSHLISRQGVGGVRDTGIPRVPRGTPSRQSLARRRRALEARGRTSRRSRKRRAA